MLREDINKLLEDKKSDYEVYLKISELFSCQKAIKALANDDELQFQIVHQSEELLLKLLVYTLITLIDYLQQMNTCRVLTLFKRVHIIQQLLIDLLCLLETMSPKEYQQIRLALGNGSGLGSPGFRGVKRIIKPLWNAYEINYLTIPGLSLDRIYDSDYQHNEAYMVAEALLEFDVGYGRFYKRHFDLIERTIGGTSKSIKGLAVEKFKQRASIKLFPALWEIRNKMTGSWGQMYGSVRDSLQRNHEQTSSIT